MQVAPVEQHFWAFPESLVSGAWAEKRALAAELRALAELCVTTDAPEAAPRANPVPANAKRKKR